MYLHYRKDGELPYDLCSVGLNPKTHNVRTAGALISKRDTKDNEKIYSEIN
jgi:hypothetical protein